MGKVGHKKHEVNTALRAICTLYQNTKWLRHFVFLKPLRGLGFNSQKCCHTFVNWYY